MLVVVGRAVTVMTTMTVTLVLCEIVPNVPVTPIVYVPGGVEDSVDMVRVEVPVEPGVNGTELGLKDVVSPVTAGGVAVSETLPVRPRLFRVTVEVPEVPATIEPRLLAEMLKSARTVTVTWAV